MTEQRWLTAFDATARERVDVAAYYYDDLMEGFKHLFEPAFLEAGLQGIGISRPSWSRLHSAGLQARPTRTFDTIGDLPMSAAHLMALKGVGFKTLDEISEAIFEHARTWRRGRIPLDDARLQALLESTAQPDADLRDGLSELASIFGM